MAQGATLSVLLLVFGAAVLIQFMFTTLEHFKNKKKNIGKRGSGKKRSGKKRSGKGRSGKGRSGKGRSGKGRSGKGRSGKGRSAKSLYSNRGEVTKVPNINIDMAGVVGAIGTLTDKLTNTIVNNKPGVTKQCQPAPYCPDNSSSGCDSDDYIKKDNIPCYGCNL